MDAVDLPLMPKGVEHYGIGGRGLPIVGTVDLPLMPKGVEHERATAALMLGATVDLPLMPKGVEHVANCFADPNNNRSRSSFDAERR